MIKGFSIILFSLLVISPSLALSDSDCAKLYASAPEAVKEKYIKRCMQDFAKSKNGDAEAAVRLEAVYSREKNYAEEINGGV